MTHRNRLSAALLLVTTGLLIWSLGDLVVPDQVLLDRDLPTFHVPLRTALQEAAHRGELLTWNSAISGGQPVLSNPNYAAFYPPTWLLAVVPVAYSIQLLIVLHSIWAGIGSFRLLRRLGSGPEAATIGAMAFALGPWFLGLGGILNWLCGMSWWPWILEAVVRTSDLAEPPTSRRRAAVTASLLFALQFLAGEPVATLLTAVAALAVLTGRLTIPGAVRRWLLIGVGAALVASIQLVPTARHVLTSARIELDASQRSTWSLPPARIPELLVPHLWGDPMRDEEGLYFGWKINDRGHPYILTPYVGLPILLVALVGLFGGTVPYRRVWGGLAALGLFLASGDHLPIVGSLVWSLPVLNWIRYPEKWIVLTSASLTVAGALSLDQVLRSIPNHAHRLKILTGTIVVGSALVVAVLWTQPSIGLSFVEEYGTGALAQKSAAVGYLLEEATFGLLLSLLLLLWTLLWSRRPTRPWLAVGFALLTAADLGHHSGSLLPTLGASLALQPPSHLATLTPGQRLVTTLDLGPEPPHLRHGPVGFHQMLGQMRQADPYSANLWGIDHVLNSDYDVMATRWAAHARRFFVEAAPDPVRRDQISAAWSASHQIEARDPGSLRREYEATGRLPYETRLRPIANSLPWARSVVQLHFLSPGDETARSPLSREGVTVSRDSCVTTDTPRGSRAAVRTLIQVERRRDGHIRLRTETRGGEGYVVVAETFHPDWRGRIVNGPQLDLCPTALGQIGFAVPSGPREVELRFRDPWIPVGAALSLSSLLAGAVLLRRTSATGSA